MARTYKRDSRGRFAGGGGGGSRSAGRKPLQRGTNRLTRDNAGRITSQGGSGATARGGRLRTASGNKRATVTARGIGKAPAGTVGRGGKVKGAARVAKPAAAVKPLSRAQIAGQRRRASETPEKSAQRRLERVRFREGQLQDKRRQLESSLNRRRGKLEGDQRKKATMELRKTRISLDRISGARQQYENTVNRRQFERNLNLAARSRGKAPSNDRTALNRLNTLRRRVQYLRKDQQDFKFDKFGGRYAGPELSKARRDLTSAIAGVRGQRVSIRTKSQAQRAQAGRSQKLINRVNSRVISTKTMQRPSSKQPNLLTGAVDRVPGRKFRSARQRPRR